MKNLYPTSIRIIAVLLILLSGMFSIAQTGMSRKDIAIKKAEEKVETNRLKLVSVKRQIEAADSLFVAGEKLDDVAKTNRKAAKEEVKAIEKTYKSGSKPLNKRIKSKNRADASSARAELKELTIKYKADLKVAQNKIKKADKDTSKAIRMISKADSKLNLLTKKLRTYEDAYEAAEKSLADKKEKK